MPCSINFSMTLQTEILSTIFSDFLKQMIILESFNSMLLDIWTEDPLTSKSQLFIFGEAVGPPI